MEENEAFWLRSSNLLYWQLLPVVGDGRSCHTRFNFTTAVELKSICLAAAATALGRSILCKTTLGIFLNVVHVIEGGTSDCSSRIATEQPRFCKQLVGQETLLDGVSLLLPADSGGVSESFEDFLVGGGAGHILLGSSG
uniref:Uncharacterized protein n=1 Tax=Glossina palpalis gambiensis TaxID=67801 RepID=A0A1B0C5D2_9MUSC